MSSVLALGGGVLAGEGGLLAGEAGAAALATAVEVLSGPVGWAILGATVVVGAVALYNAHQKAKTQLKPADTAQPCHDCGDGPDCFEPPDRSDPKSLQEFRRQLKAQQDGINKMSPRDIMRGIDKYASGGRQAFPEEAALRKAFRQERWNRVFDQALDSTGDEGKAAAQANAALEDQAALHNPDLVAGGNPRPTDLGGASENSSLGSQWAKTGSGSKLTRAQQLRKAAEKAEAEDKDTMDVNLEEC